MGWTYVKFQMRGHVSSHNSEQDDIDHDLWEEFTDRIRAIAKEHRYESLDLNE